MASERGETTGRGANGVGGEAEGGRQPGGGRRGAPSRAAWVSSEPTLMEVEELRRRFPEVVRLPVEEVRAEEERWGAEAVVLKSLGRWVATEAVARELRLRAGLKGDVAVIAIDQGHCIARFHSSDDRDKVMGRPWVVSGQLLAVEGWSPRFRPSPEAISTALVWIRLPSLPIELWGPESLRAIASFAGEVVSIDDWTLRRNRGAYARVCVRLDLSSPLRPGVIIDGPGGGHWQSFVFESAGGVCLGCGRFHGKGSPCDGAASVLSSENVTGEEEGAAAPTTMKFGSWLVAVKQWLPRDEKAEGRRNGLSSQRPAGTAAVPARGCPDGLPESDGWSKPAKVARRGAPTSLGVNGRAVPGGACRAWVDRSAGQSLEGYDTEGGGVLTVGGQGSRTLTSGRFQVLQTGTQAGSQGMELGMGSVQLKPGGSAALMLKTTSEREQREDSPRRRCTEKGVHYSVLLDRGKAKLGEDVGNAKRPRSPARVLDRERLPIVKARGTGAGSTKMLGTRKMSGKRGKAMSMPGSGAGPQARGEARLEQGEGGVFIFSAAEGGGPGPDDIVEDPAHPPRMSHEETVGRLRHAMQTEEEGSLHQQVEQTEAEEGTQREGSLGNDLAGTLHS